MTASEKLSAEIAEMVTLVQEGMDRASKQLSNGTLVIQMLKGAMRAADQGEMSTVSKQIRRAKEVLNS